MELTAKAKTLTLEVRVSAAVALPGCLSRTYALQQAEADGASRRPC